MNPPERLPERFPENLPENAVLAEFASAKSQGRAVLIGYWPAGYPDLDTSVRMVEAMVAGGVDMVEIGLPYSDPLMDGPIIAKAAEQALRAGMTPQAALEVVSRVANTSVPVLVMTYWNLVEQFGTLKFAQDLVASGGVGVITPDLTVEEAGQWIVDSDAANVARVFLAAPSSPADRLDVVVGACTGFVYAASLMGVTGTRTSMSAGARTLVERLRGHTDLPIAVGLGVSTPDQAREVASYADGVIVGSAFVRQLADCDDVDQAEVGVRTLAADLAAAVRGDCEPTATGQQ